MHDLKYAFRQLAKSPGYALVVILTLAFGIAVNTNLYGIVSLFFLRERTVPEPDRLVLVLQRSDAWKMPHNVSFPDFKDYRSRLKTVRGLFAFLQQPANLGAEGKSPERTWIEVTTPDAFASLGVGAQLGRTLVPSDGESKGGAPIVVLSHRYWQQHFGGDPAILGRSIIINGQPFTVVGVAEQKFDGFSSMLAIGAFVPVGALDALRENGSDMLEWRGSPAWRLMGRLAPGVTLDDARAEVAVVTRQFVHDFPDSHRGVQPVVLSERLSRPDPIVSDYLPVFAAFFTGLVALVLFIACANVANLMFARAVTRQHELTVRAALGASRTRLVRQLLLESLLLAIGAGLVGWVLAGWTGELLARFSPQGDVPVALDVGPRWQDYTFTAVISLLAGLASGLLPALRASRIDLVEQLKEGSAGGLAGRRHRVRNFLVVSQVTFSLVVLVGAGLFLRSLHRVGSIDLGFRTDRLLLVSFDLGLQGYKAPRAQTFHDQLLDRVRALPGVTDAALTTHVPFDYAVNGQDIWPENPAPTLPDGHVVANFAVVTPGFQEMLGIRHRSGRTLDRTDSDKSRRVVVVNSTLAQMCWPGEDATGKRFRPWKDGPFLEIVGVAETAKYVMLSEPPKPYYYVPLAQDFSSPLNLVVRTDGDPAALTSSVRNVIRTLDPHLPLYNVRTMDELMGSSMFALMPLRMGATLAGIQGVIGLLLSVMGLYAVVSFGVTQRTREIGIRMALGADATQVRRFVVNEGLRLTVLGLGIGSVLSMLLGFGLSKVLYGLDAFDPIVLPGVTVLLVAVAVLACWLPAQRATKVDPMTALRAE
jgi:predicted permease